MSYIALYRKYRPQSFGEVAEQETIVNILSQALRLGKISHAYLFAGPKGTGKTTVARIFAKGLNCINGPTDKPCQSCKNCAAITNGNSLDVLEIDAASNRGIDEIRELKGKVNYVPVSSKYKVYIIDESHMLTPQAFNALLKTLEEPPSNVLFILATTEPDKIPPTILSRCEHFYFKPITIAGLSKKIKYVSEKEGINITEDAIHLIARVSSGSLRNSLSLLDQVITMYGDNINDEQVRSLLEVPDENLLSSFIDSIITNNPVEVLNKINLLKDSGKDAKVFIFELIDYLQDLITGKVSGFETLSAKRDQNMIEIMREQSKNTYLKKMTEISEILLEAAAKIKLYRDPYFPILLSSLNMMNFEEYRQVQSVSTKKEELELRKEVQIPYESEIPKTAQEPGLISIDTIKTRWEEITNLVKSNNAPLYAMLIRVYPVELREDLLVLGAEKDFYLTMLKKTENISTIEKAVKDIIGKPIRVTFAEPEKKQDISKDEIIQEISQRKEIKSILKLFDGAITDVKDSEEEK